MSSIENVITQTINQLINPSSTYGSLDGDQYFGKSVIVTRITNAKFHVAIRIFRTVNEYSLIRSIVWSVA